MHDPKCLSPKQDETPGMESDATVSADESEDVDILSDFVPPESNILQNNEASTSAKPSDATDSEGSTAFLSTFAGDHNYCCSSVPMDIETGQSEQDDRQSEQDSRQSEIDGKQSGQEGRQSEQEAQSGHESSPKVIIESQQGEQVSIRVGFFLGGGGGRECSPQNLILS